MQPIILFKSLLDAWRIGLFFTLVPTSHLSTAGCWTQLEPLTFERAFRVSISPVPSSGEWSWDWLPWCLLPWWGECWLPWVGLLGSWLISFLSARFSSSTSRTRSSRASVEDWGSSGDRGSGFTEDEKTRQSQTQATFDICKSYRDPVIPCGNWICKRWVLPNKLKNIN